MARVQIKWCVLPWAREFVSKAGSSRSSAQALATCHQLSDGSGSEETKISHVACQVMMSFHKLSGVVYIAIFRITTVMYYLLDVLCLSI